jgi:hypothetical protein
MIKIKIDEPINIGCIARTEIDGEQYISFYSSGIEVSIKIQNETLFRFLSDCIEFKK